MLIKFKKIYECSSLTGASLGDKLLEDKDYLLFHIIVRWSKNAG